MKVTEPIADFLTRIRNAQKANHRIVEVPASNMKKRLTEILYEHGFIFRYKFEEEGLLLLTNHGIFYEFIPLEHYGKPDQNEYRLTLDQIELDKDYALILTTNSGLWAYSIGDVVRFINKKPYKILVGNL